MTVSTVERVPEILSRGKYSVRILHEFGKGNYLDPFKLRDLWVEFSKHPVLFTDEVAGDFEAFFDILTTPNSVWLEVFDTEIEKPVAVAVFTRVVPGYDALSHVAIWDSKASEKIDICRDVMEWGLEKWNLHRLSAEIPVYQRGTLRFAERVGFKREGIKRECDFRRGSWVDTAFYGILKEELDGLRNGD